jgi:hypothetical protein
LITTAEPAAADFSRNAFRDTLRPEALLIIAVRA